MFVACLVAAWGGFAVSEVSAAAASPLLRQPVVKSPNIDRLPPSGLDRIGVPLSGDKLKFKCQELYGVIHRLRSQVLLPHKRGCWAMKIFRA